MLREFVALSIGLVILPSIAAQNADFPSDLERWYVTDPPEVDTVPWSVANSDKHEWVVTPGDAGPRVSLLSQQKDVPSPLPFEIKPGSARDGLAGERKAAKVDDGWIVSFNAGEFGAGLWWFSPDGEKRFKISDDHVVSLVPTSSGLLAAVGLAHGAGAPYKGRVLRLSRDANGPWVTEALFDLGGAPEVMAKDSDGSLLVATYNRLLRIFPASKKIDVIVDNAFWDGGLYPNSLVMAPSGTIFVGMRHGIAKVEKNGKSYKVFWLIRRKMTADDYEKEFSGLK